MKDSGKEKIQLIYEIEKLINEIKSTAENQRSYKSNHKYDLDRFGLSEGKIKKDCKLIYETFLAEWIISY